MSIDADNIERAYRLIEGYVGESELPEGIKTFEDLLFDVRNFGPDDCGDTFRELGSIGKWAVEAALKQFLRDMAEEDA